jgi:ElaB/YqjD/DUF883 family membrane-anchored ribosome-binding protein
MASEPDVNRLHEEIDQTRANLTEKLQTLENQVMGTVQSALGTVSNARENVEGTIEQVTSTVQETVETVKSTVEETVEQVKKTFDLDYQMQVRPWFLVGGSVAAGLLVGALVGRESRGVRHGGFRGFTGHHPGPYPPAEGRAAPEMESAGTYLAPRSEPAGPSFFQGLLQQFRPELEKVKEMAIGYAAGAVRDMVKQSLPAFGQQIDEIMNDVTNKLGGTPVQGPVLSTAGGTTRGREDGGLSEGRFNR